VLADPPFSRIDLISCRNLLIYLEPVLQQKIVPTLHYALKPAGCLWLGGSETIGGYRNLFEAQDATHKIYAKKPGAGAAAAHFPLQHGGSPRPPFTPMAARPGDVAADLPREADRVLLAKFAPPGVLVSADLDILQYRGDTGPYLAPAPGKASFSLLKMLREGLLVAVRAAILRAGKEKIAVREEGLRVKSNGGYRDVAIEVIPLKGAGVKEGGFLILFEEKDEGGRMKDEPGKDSLHPSSFIPHPFQLEQELASTRDYLQSLIEEQESINEELQSANEEVHSGNEELQSVNEELETSKEEIQSSNEELATVNDELNNRNTVMNRVNNDLVNLLGSVQMPIVILGPDLRVRRFTPTAEKLLNLVPADVGRPLADIKLKLNLDDLPDLEPLLAEVLDTVSTRERDVRDKHGRWYSLRLRPYKTLDNKIDGVVVMLVDVDAMKRAYAYTESIVATVREPLLVLDKDLRVRTTSRSFYETFGVAPEDTENRLLYELGNSQWDIPDLRRLLEEVLPRDNQVNDFEVDHKFEQIGTKTMRLNARRLVQAADQAPLILLAIEDVTESDAVKKALREGEQRFRVLFDLGPVAVYSCDVSGVIQEFNRRAAVLWGRAPARGDTDERFCGSFKMHLPDGTFMPHERCPMAEVLCGKIPAARDVEVLIERPDGSRVTVLVNIVPLTNERGEITGAINCFYDITERKLAEETLGQSEHRLRFIMDSAPQKIFTAKPNGAIDYFNPQWTEFTGLSFEQIKGWGWKQFIHPDDVEENVRLWQHAIDTGEPFQFEQRFRRADGEYRWHLSRAQVMRDAEGNVVMWVGSNTDIHEQRQTANQLRQYAADLSESDRRKNEFLAMLAHELRNPLAPIRNALQIMTLMSGDEKAVRSASQMMERQVGQMVRLVDDLLDVSRISRGKIELRKGRIELASAVNHAIEAARSQFKSMDHELTITLPPKPIFLNADPTRLAQVVGNLLNNACKFTNKGGRIWLTVEREGEQAVIRVRDSGIGIAADQLPRVFDMFMQADTSLERLVSGLGIGLTLVQDLVEMHEGTVEVHSAGVGQGSEFVVRLPLWKDEGGRMGAKDEGGRMKDESGQESPASSFIPHPSSLKVLVVDDNRDSAMSLAMLLELTGNETHTAYDGLEAVEAAATLRPDVVLLDIGLPKLNGYEAARKIREQPWGKSMVLVALTGWGQEEDRRRSEEVGFNAHMVKPVELAALQKLLAGLKATTA
jgi:PAS domain S-box-containing protein